MVVVSLPPTPPAQIAQARCAVVEYSRNKKLTVCSGATVAILKSDAGGAREIVVTVKVPSKEGVFGVKIGEIIQTDAKKHCLKTVPKRDRQLADFNNLFSIRLIKVLPSKCG